MVEAEGGGRRTRLPGTPVIRWPSFHMILRIGHPSSTPPPHLAAEGRKKMQSALTVMKKNRLRVIRMNDASSSSSIVSTYVHLFCLRLSRVDACLPPLSRRDLATITQLLSRNGASRRANRSIHGDSNRFAVIFFDKPGLRRGRGIAVNRSRGLVEGRIERERERYTRLSCLQNEDVVVWTLPHGEKQDPMPGTRGKKPMIPVIHETFYAGWPE